MAKPLYSFRCHTYHCPKCNGYLSSPGALLINGHEAGVNDDVVVEPESTGTTAIILTDHAPDVVCAHCKTTIEVDPVEE